jgi:L-amino acid N-acyltransferase YncA
MELLVRAYNEADLPQMADIWNTVVINGEAFPQTDALDLPAAAAFFAAQDYCGVVETDGTVVGLYILHPNNIGRCGHIGNASYAVDKAKRGQGIGRALVSDSLRKAKALGFRLMQFNAVVATNTNALHLYESLGFQRLGTIPGGFRMDDRFEDIVLFYHTLENV